MLKSSNIEGNACRMLQIQYQWMQNIVLVNLFYKKYIVTIIVSYDQLCANKQHR